MSRSRGMFYNMNRAHREVSEKEAIPAAFENARYKVLKNENRLKKICHKALMSTSKHGVAVKIGKCDYKIPAQKIRKIINFINNNNYVTRDIWRALEYIVTRGEDYSRKNITKIIILHKTSWANLKSVETQMESEQ